MATYIIRGELEPSLSDINHSIFVVNIWSFYGNNKVGEDGLFWSVSKI